MTNSQKLKKDRERKYLEILRENILDFPKGNFYTHESPDFIINKTGIEVTEIMNENLKQVNSLKWQILNKAREKYESHDLPPIQLNANFNNLFVKTLDKESCVEQLYKKVLESISNIKEKNLIEFSIDSGKISIIRSPFLTRNYWLVNSGGFVKEEITQELQNAIDKKNFKYKEYTKKCKECWLIIGASNFDEASLYEPSEFTIENFYHSCFDRIYFIDLFTRKCLKLNSVKFSLN